jgi:hypothetical protein
MSERYEFSGAEVLALVEEAVQADERLMTEAQRLVASGIDLESEELPEDDAEHPGTGAAPGLWLMNHRGIHLRSNAADGGERVAFAHGFRSELPVGDEPMCEFVDAAPLAQLRPDDTLVVTLDKHKIRLSLLRPQA